jgi:hypothetical protein
MNFKLTLLERTTCVPLAPEERLRIRRIRRIPRGCRIRRIRRGCRIRPSRTHSAKAQVWTDFLKSGTPAERRERLRRWDSASMARHGLTWKP